MTATNIEAKVKSIIADQLGVSEDEIPDEEAENIKAVGDAINYITTHKKG